MPKQKYNLIAIEVIATVFKVTKDDIRLAISGKRKSANMQKIKKVYEHIEPKAKKGKEKLIASLSNLKYVRDLL